MLARALTPLTGAKGRERWLALAASLAFHLVVIGALLWLFVPSADERVATVTIEVTIVGADGLQSPPNTDATQAPQTTQTTAKPQKPPAPAVPAAESKDAHSAPMKIDALPPPSPASDAVPLPASLAPPAPGTSVSPRTEGTSQPQTGTAGAASTTGSSSAGTETGAAGQAGSADGDRPPRYKLGSGSTPYPPYPVVARRNGYQGRVLVRLDVAADGRATGAEVLESSGYDVLDQSAVEALKAWKLEPALTGGRPVPGSVNVPVRFRLSG